MKFRIYGDNIVECERALQIVADSLGGEPVWLSDSDPLCPVFVFSDAQEKIQLECQLLSGHGRWGIDLAGHLRNLGSMFREGADAIITRIDEDGEKLLLGIEFCGALPAGNNAWQRHGRALGYAQAGIPYLIFAEVGGQELDSERKVKASRFPNPAVPFAFIQVTRDLKSPTIPVYSAAPSAPSSVTKEFHMTFGAEEARSLILKCMLGETFDSEIENLLSKAINVVELLTSKRQKRDTIRETTWKTILDSQNRFSEFAQHALTWKPTSAGKVSSTDTARKFKELLEKYSSGSILSASLPFTWLTEDAKNEFALALKAIYPTSLSSVLTWIEQSQGPLAVCLVTGFKPKGDDSRPDRGLIPLARMLIGPSANLLTFIWGPAKRSLLTQMESNIQLAAESNGLIESVIASSNAVIADSINSTPFGVVVNQRVSRESDKLPYRNLGLTSLGEHDVDTLTHFFFTQPTEPNIFEGMCNPPGGDWSGVSLIDAKNREVRWTSLPRVSQSGAKRPDHVIQILSGESEGFTLVVESKKLSRDLERGVGQALGQYLIDLMKSSPSVGRIRGSSEWTNQPEFESHNSWSNLVSVGSYLWIDESDMFNSAKNSGCDLYMGWEVDRINVKVILHVHAESEHEYVISSLAKRAKKSKVKLEIHQH